MQFSPPQSLCHSYGPQCAVLNTFNLNCPFTVPGQVLNPYKISHRFILLSDLIVVSVDNKSEDKRLWTEQYQVCSECNVFLISCPIPSSYLKFIFRVIQFSSQLNKLVTSSNEQSSVYTPLGILLTRVSSDNMVALIGMCPFVEVSRHFICQS